MLNTQNIDYKKYSIELNPNFRVNSSEEILCFTEPRTLT